MTKSTLSAILLSLLSLTAVACGDAGNFEEDLEFVDENEDNQEALIAPFDNDSAADPAVDEFLSITGVREIEYTDVISAEAGDNQDFVQFELPNASNEDQRIEVGIDCEVLGDQAVSARVEMLNLDGNATTRIFGGPIDCNEGFFLVTINNTQKQLARIHVQGLPQEQTLIEYTLMVKPFR